MLFSWQLTEHSLNTEKIVSVFINVKIYHGGWFVTFIALRLTEYLCFQFNRGPSPLIQGAKTSSYRNAIVQLH